MSEDIRFLNKNSFDDLPSPKIYIPRSLKHPVGYMCIHIKYVYMYKGKKWQKTIKIITNDLGPSDVDR